MTEAHDAREGAWVGRPLRRREDPRLLVGAGTYVDDLRLEGCLHVALLRSPHAHARIARLDVEPARRAAGVVTVATGADVRHLAPMPVNRVMPDMKVPSHPILAERVVTAVGVPVAAVVAESAAVARDALELIAVDYVPLPAAPEAAGALAPGAPVLAAETPGNRVFARTLREGDAAAALARSAHRASIRIAQARISGVPLEPRSVVARWDAAAGELTLWVSCQAPFRIRGEVARLLDLPESRVRVIAPEVGGGFGVKTGPYREDVLLAWLAHRLGRPVRWIATRGEDMVTTNHARGARALAAADHAGLRRAQAARRARGEVVGVGLASYVEPCALGWESGSVKVERSGRVTAITGASAHGQGHETTFAQIVADHLGVTPDDVSVLHGDTRSGPEGFGTFGSRSTALGGGALVQVARVVRDKGRRIAARLLEAAAADIVPVEGGFHVTGMPARRVTWKDVAGAAWAGGAALPPGETPGLEAATYFQPEGEVWSFGAVVAAVSIDRETGCLAIERLVWVDDAGTIVNPLLAEGQLHGSLARGLGQALLERIVYDPSGQLLTGTLMDYALPRADEVPPVTIEKMHTPSPRNPLGAKGLGEAGCIAIPPALVNAAVDALAPFGVVHLDMPLTPERLWAAMQRPPAA